MVSQAMHAQKRRTDDGTIAALARMDESAGPTEGTLHPVGRTAAALLDSAIMRA